jgi:hypothetical protein
LLAPAGNSLFPLDNQVAERARVLEEKRLALLEKAQVLGLQPDPKLEDGLLQFSGKGGAPPKVGTVSACISLARTTAPG